MNSRVAARRRKLQPLSPDSCRLAQLGDRLPRHRIDHSGAISASGPQDELALAEVRVRNPQPVLVDDVVAVENQIEIERARRHRVGPHPAPLFFDLQQAVQQIARRQLRQSRRRRRSDTDRARRRRPTGSVSMNGRTLMSARSIVQRIDGVFEMRAPIAEIAAQCDGAHAGRGNHV